MIIYWVQDLTVKYALPMIAGLTASLWIGWEDWLGGPWKQEEAGLLPQGWKGGEEAEGWA